MEQGRPDVQLGVVHAIVAEVDGNGDGAAWCWSVRRALAQFLKTICLPNGISAQRPQPLLVSSSIPPPRRTWLQSEAATRRLSVWSLVSVCHRNIQCWIEHAWKDCCVHPCTEI